jgi:C4-dicarboxylate-specific signal transduction histidine kinase
LPDVSKGFRGHAGDRRRERLEPFTDRQIELVTDFAAQATIGLEITNRERRLREVQTALARANRIATIGEMSSSIAH